MNPQDSIVRRNLQSIFITDCLNPTVCILKCAIFETCSSIHFGVNSFLFLWLYDIVVDCILFNIFLQKETIKSSMRFKIILFFIVTVREGSS